MVVETATPEQRGYAHPELLATTEWLQDRLDDPQLRVVDMDHPHAYPRVHIPGAVRVQDHYFKGQRDPLQVQDADEFSETMANLGIGDDTTVVAYDSDGGHFAARLFWALEYYGHSDVKLLDGGFPRWFAEGRPLDRAESVYPKGSFTARARPELIASRHDVLRMIHDAEVALWDVRTDEEWAGENDRGTARGGRIPGAVHLEWKNLLTAGDVPVIKPADDLREMLSSVSLTPDKKITSY